MGLAELNREGELPIGVHRTTMNELLARFGGGTPRRMEVARRLSRIYELARNTGSLDRLVVFGSFVTNKAEPGDVDVILVMCDDFELQQLPVESQLLFDHSSAEIEFGASVFWIRPSLLIIESLEEFIASWQRKRGGGRRGIVEVTA